MIKFSVFADFHYKKRMYTSSLEDLDHILSRANDAQVDFIIHAGDFCNDYAGSPELMRAYHENKYGIPTYGVYGNHELETVGNTMEIVTPKLSNQSICHAKDEKGNDLGYWYADVKDFRIIGLDTNYSYNEEQAAWEHNHPASYGCPAGNRYSDSLAPCQLAWLDQTLADAKEKGLKVITVSHACLSGIWYQRDTEIDQIHALFAKYPNTVLLSINGHEHKDHFAVVDGVAYFDVNSTTNGFWEKRTDYHYDDAHTFRFTDYDANGNPISTENFELNKLRQGSNTWFFTNPMSAIVTVTAEGRITIEGEQTEWRYGIPPYRFEDGVKTAIEDREIQL